jgi:hypothetical protein
MPFTLAHPAIILPLGNTRFRLSITGLVIGSMVPDFEFFFQLREVENIGHHWYGILLFDMPVALVGCFLFHNLLRNVLIANLPAYYKFRFTGLLQFDWNKYVADYKWKVLLSILIGIGSHLFLDAFTHADGLFVEMFPVLAYQTGTNFFNAPVYLLLQVLFSLAGLLLVHRAIHQLPVNSKSTDTAEQTNMYWSFFAMILLLIIGIRLVGWPEYNSFWSVIMAMMGGTIYSWFLVSLIFNYYLLKKISL